MHVSSRFAACLVFALAILITLGGIGVPNLQAQDQSQGGSCPQACPPPPCPVPECPKKPCCRANVPECPCPRRRKRPIMRRMRLPRLAGDNSGKSRKLSRESMRLMSMETTK